MSKKQEAKVEELESVGRALSNLLKKIKNQSLSE